MDIQENETAEKDISDVIPLSYNGKTMNENTVTVRFSRMDAKRIDDAVEKGLFTNRSDFIRTAVRNLADRYEAIPEVMFEIWKDAKQRGVTQEMVRKWSKQAGKEAHRKK